MGSPAFAVPALKALLDCSNYNVVCVYTREPKPFGRGHKVQKTPVHLLAETHNIPVLSPKTLKGHTIEYEADIIVVAAYGMILPKSLLENTEYGCINIHPSLLPRWRGSTPLQHAILSGDKETGVCIIKITEELDAGDIFAVKKVEMQELDDYQSLHDKLAIIGSELLISVMNNIKDIRPVEQGSEGITYAYKIKKELIDWNEKAINIVRKIRALQGMECVLYNQKIKLIKARSAKFHHNKSPGDVINDEWYIACNDNEVLIPEIIQVPGKKPLHIKDFLRGNSKKNS